MSVEGKLIDFSDVRMLQAISERNFSAHWDGINKIPFNRLRLYFAYPAHFRVNSCACVF